MRLLPLLLLFTLLIACTNNTDETAVRKTIATIYSKPDPYHNQALDTAVFSIALDSLVKAAKEVEKMDRERVLKSEYPTDKPKLIEGEIFAGLYEGYTSFTVEHVEIKESQAKAVLAFENKNYNTQWKDTLVLSREKGWKLNDVCYGKGGSFYALLGQFIKGE